MFGQISVKQFLPVSSYNFSIKTMVQVGTPEILVTSSLKVARAIFSTFSSQLLINAMANSGVRKYCAQKGIFCIITADKSP